jgi:hemolysin D
MNNSLLAPIRRGFLSLVQTSGRTPEREFLPAALEIIETPASPAGRSIGLIIVVAAITAVTWASLAKIDIVTSAPGRIIMVGRSKIIQPFQAGIVQSINVSDGDHVVAGQVLIVLDPTAAKADVRRLAQDLRQAELDRSRLEGLRTVLGTTKTPVLIDVPVDAAPTDIAAANAQMLAQALQESAKLADIDHQVAEKQSEADQAVAAIDKVETDEPFLKQVADMRTTLLKQQVGSKLDWLAAEQELAESGPNIASARAQQNAALAAVSALREERAETEGDYAKGVLNDFEQAEQKGDEAKQDLIKANQQLALTILNSSVSGTVQGLAIHTIGGIVSPGEDLLTIVPDNERLMVEVSIQNRDVGFVRVGQNAQVKIGAFDFTRFGGINGKITSITKDVVDQEPNMAPQNDGYTQGAEQNGLALGDKQREDSTTQQEPAYVAHILLERNAVVTDVGIVALQPGMAVTADIKTGQRRVISYFMAPFAHQVEEAGHER